MNTISSHQNNAADLEHELNWFNDVLETRIALYFKQECSYSSIHELIPPDLTGTKSAYASFVTGHRLDVEERLVLMLALIPHIRPQLLDTFFVNNVNFNRPFTEFGGWKGETHSGFLPTGETVSFLLAGMALSKRFEIMRIFDDLHLFARKNVLKLVNNLTTEPFFSGALVIGGEYLNMFTTGLYHKPDYNMNFPAKRISTKLSWQDLVVSTEVHDEIELIGNWIKHEKTIMEDWQLDKVLTPGYRVLFHGPPGTGKTLTASLLGKSLEMDVYRIDLSTVVSKYIGETEKNLANIFDQAENKRWILFFDEADALFGKRTQTSSSNDRHANQEVSYLLQRIEDFPGIVILATNLKANIDEAFARRFQAVIHFPIPEAEQRLCLWQNMLNGRIDDSVVLEHLAGQFELSGGAMVNVARFAAIKTLQKGGELITRQELHAGIVKELMKEGKTV